MKEDRDVTIVETSPRDGLSYVKGITTADKICLIDKLAETGLGKIDSVAFTHPALFPKCADAEDVINAVKKRTSVIFSGMVTLLLGKEVYIKRG